MLFHQKVILLPSDKSSNQGGRKFKCHDYSTIIDIDVYKGGYDDYYCRIFYTTPGDYEMSENKEVSLLCINEHAFINSQKDYKESDFDKRPEKIVLDDKYRFFKSVKLGTTNVPYNIFIYLHEELSVTELRDAKIGEIVT